MSVTARKEGIANVVSGEVRQVLHVIPYMHASYGGPPVVVRRLSDNLSAFGWQSRILTTPTGYKSSIDAQKSLSDLDVDFHESGWSGLVRDMTHLKYTETEPIRRVLSSADLVHIHTLWSPLGLQVHRALRLAPRPVVVSPHGMLDPGSMARRKWKKRLYLELFERHLLQAAHGMLYTANDEKRAAEALLAKMPQGHTVALGADPFPFSDRDRLRAEFLSKNPSLSQRPRLLHLGRIHEMKAVDRTIASLVEVRRKLPDVVFMLAGNGEPEYIRSLSRQVAKLKLKDSVVFLGFVEGKSKHEALAAADLFILPSHHENFGIAIAEAMQAGLPVVISRNVSIWQEVSAAGAGAIVGSAVEPEEIASEILRLICDSAKLAQASAAALDLASRSYSWETAARNTSQIYHDILMGWGHKDRP